MVVGALPRFDLLFPQPAGLPTTSVPESKSRRRDSILARLNWSER